MKSNIGWCNACSLIDYPDKILTGSQLTSVLAQSVKTSASQVSKICSNRMVIEVLKVNSHIVMWLTFFIPWVVTCAKRFYSDLYILHYWICDVPVIVSFGGFNGVLLMLVILHKSNVNFFEVVQEGIIWHPEYSIVSFNKVYLLLPSISPCGIIISP